MRHPVVRMIGNSIYFQTGKPPCKAMSFFLYSNFQKSETKNNLKGHYDLGLIKYMLAFGQHSVGHLGNYADGGYLPAWWGDRWRCCYYYLFIPFLISLKPTPMLKRRKVMQLQQTTIPSPQLIAMTTARTWDLGQPVKRNTILFAAMIY